MSTTGARLVDRFSFDHPTAIALFFATVFLTFPAFSDPLRSPDDHDGAVTGREVTRLSASEFPIAGQARGLRDDRLGGDRGFDANVFEYHAWIDSAAGSGCHTSACGSLAPIDVQRHLLCDTARIDAATSPVEYRLETPAGIARLSVAMNGEDSGAGANNFDLYLMSSSQGDRRRPLP